MIFRLKSSSSTGYPLHTGFSALCLAAPRTIRLMKFSYGIASPSAPPPLNLHIALVSSAVRSTPR